MTGSWNSRTLRWFRAVATWTTAFGLGVPIFWDGAAMAMILKFSTKSRPPEPIVLTDMGIPLDEEEDLLLESVAYRQASRVLLPKMNGVRGRPLTPLHGGHVGLLCTAGMLNGVFGEGEGRHIAHWCWVKFTDHWEEEEEDGTKILHDRERFFARADTSICQREDPDCHA